MQAYLKEIKGIFQEHANPTIAKGAKAYMLHQFEFYGIKTPLRRKLSKDFYKAYPIYNTKELKALIQLCFKEPQRELHYFAIELLGFHKKLWNVQTITLIEWILTHNSWWDSVDGTNTHVIGKYFQLFPELVPKITDKWNQSNNFWLQRMSILFQLTYRKQTNLALLTKYIENRQLEKEFFVRKAIGWALRAYTYTDPAWVISFVKKHPELSNLSKREALKRV